ncbi:hypothetical protein GO308_12715 [Sphingomonas sp. SFZ2018-12]|uniref:hypothetical protein n=1 Tax=Sphingomonas sp. SFZ2018-12 TaxID=2683197 RepID=UPI001F10C90D|nr:hypothetical protein [Sphingomonas sp. SFZ2018-12]MCH4893977.1 hypothetical protein [Sphingomonas sp. SFZ2018-12]
MSAADNPREVALRLVEASGDLLEACKCLDAFWSEDGSTPNDPHWSPEMKDVWQKIRAAVAKAEGRQA